MAEGHQRGRKPTWDEKGKMRNAIYRDDITTIERMIKEDGIDVNAVISNVRGIELIGAFYFDTQWTGLHYATYNNKLESIKKLVELGADITVTNRDRDTPLDMAVQQKNISVIHYFIEKCNPHISKLKKANRQKIQGIKKDLQEKEKIEKIAFSLALREGKSKALSIKLLLFGPEYVGKTCVATTLVGDPYEESSATEGVDLDICNTSNWKKISPEESSQRLQSKYLGNLKSCAESKTNTAEANFKAESSSHIEKKRNFFTKTVIRVFSSLKRSQPTKSIENQLPPMANNDEIKKSKNVSRQLVPTIEYDEIEGAKATVAKTDQGIDVTILDFAGQVQYHNTHAVFIRKENVIMVVFNASQPLSRNVKVRSSTLRSDPMTNSQNIHFWMKTVHSVCREPGDENDKATLLPVILLVATHLDLLEDPVEEAKEEIIQIIAKELEGKPYAQHLAGQREGLVNALRKYCIFLSNKVRDSESISQLQDAIVELSFPILSREHPLVFLKIERELMGIEKGVITIKEFHAITYSCGFLADMNSEEFVAALEYFHHCGTILHFASIESLKELVILSPHWLTKLFSYVLIAHPYQRIGSIGRSEDISFHILTEKGILLGSFLTYMLECFNSSERVAGFEVERQQTIDIMKKFGFVAQISPKAKFLEEVKITNEKELFIVPSLLPDDTANLRQIPEENDRNVRVVYFYLPDHFLPPILFDQVVTKCIDRNEYKRETILWLRKGKAMMALGHGQCYCISSCEEKFSIRLSFVFLQGGGHLAEHRKELLQYVHANLEVVMEDFMSATKKPIAYIPCCYCKDLHVELQLLLEGEQQYCPKDMQPVPNQYYCDLTRDKVSQVDIAQSATTTNFDCSAAKKNVIRMYHELTNLPIDSMLSKLLAKKVILEKEKEIIGSIPIKSDKMEYFLDNIINPSLANNVAEKFEGFLEVMEESGDLILIDMAKRVGSKSDKSTSTQQTSEDIDIPSTDIKSSDMSTAIADDIDCSTAQNNIQKHYKELTYLPIKSMLSKLYSKGIITLEEKEKIKAKPVESQKMEYFLDRIITPSLVVNVQVKFKGFLEVMKDSGDSTLISMATKLGKP